MKLLLAVTLISLVLGTETKSDGSLTINKEEMLNKITEYSNNFMKDMFSKSSRAMRSGYEDEKDEKKDDELVLYLFLGAAAIFLPLILGGIALLAILPFIGTQLNPLTGAAGGTGAGLGTLGTGIGIGTFNGGRRRRETADLVPPPSIYRGISSLIHQFKISQS